MTDRRDKKSATEKMALVKLKKRKVKEGRTFLALDEVSRDSSGYEGNLGFIKEQKSTRADHEKKTSKVSLKKKKKRENGNKVDTDNSYCEDKKGLNGLNSGGIVGTGYAKESCQSKQESKIVSLARTKEQDIPKKIKHKKVKKDRKSERQHALVPVEGMKVATNSTGSEMVDEILGVDEDCSRGMKKWLVEYKQNRPGLRILQERIDEFISAHEAQQEQERKEKEARAAEGGWTVVVHHKGRKKTTDSESGISVGSVAQAAVMDKMATKKHKEFQDFYRFQRREAQMNEVMMLQSKFEQDKKRIQQLRAARKFRPY